MSLQSVSAGGPAFAPFANGGHSGCCRSKPQLCRFSRPYGTGFGFSLSHPALKRRAIIKRPPDAGGHALRFLQRVGFPDCRGDLVLLTPSGETSTLPPATD